MGLRGDQRPEPGPLLLRTCSCTYYLDQQQASARPEGLAPGSRAALKRMLERALHDAVSW